MKNSAKVTWDSNVLIDAIQKDVKWWPEIRAVYKDALLSEIKIVVSEISIAEVCKLNGMATSGIPAQEIIKKISLFFQNPFIERRPVDRRESIFAAELIREFNLETCDAVIAATASLHSSILYTRDGLKPKKGKTKLLDCDGKIGSPALPIKCPNAADYEKFKAVRLSLEADAAQQAAQKTFGGAGK
jgi:predicted nucleic acid-binding protein